MFRPNWSFSSQKNPKCCNTSKDMKQKFSITSHMCFLTFTFHVGLLLPGGGEGRPGHADGQQRQQDGSQQPDPQGHPVRGGHGSPCPPSPPPSPGHWSHLRGSAQPSTAVVGVSLSLSGNHPVAWTGRWKRERGKRIFEEEEKRWRFSLNKKYLIFAIIIGYAETVSSLHWLFFWSGEKKMQQKKCRQTSHTRDIPKLWAGAATMRLYTSSIIILGLGVYCESHTVFLSGLQSNQSGVSPGPTAAAFQSSVSRMFYQLHTNLKWKNCSHANHLFHFSTHIFFFPLLTQTQRYLWPMSCRRLKKKNHMRDTTFFPFMRNRCTKSVALHCCHCCC